tara:strand:+ start:857 stop:1261 length:405 start_codon:yes stop_codon:yes gene_type:complete
MNNTNNFLKLSPQNIRLNSIKTTKSPSQLHWKFIKSENNSPNSDETSKSDSSYSDNNERKLLSENEKLLSENEKLLCEINYLTAKCRHLEHKLNNIYKYYKKMVQLQNKIFINMRHEKSNFDGNSIRYNKFPRI